ncbi:MAG: glucosidase [Bryobacteraceae bacterium]|nr:glucosidase [Bryobacteraceae bacterium]
MNAERMRLEEAARREKHWRRWGPYVSERAWGTVREDYSAKGAAWEYTPHTHARFKAYRWGEDGIGGWCDNHQRICLALALWNQHDPYLKERLFGLAGGEGNHGEDVKEYYYYLDATPTYSYAKFLYKYPQTEFLYGWLAAENRRRGKTASEFELIDTGIFDQDRYFDVVVEYAKADVDDTLVRITAFNRGPDPAPLHILPTVWFRNRWSWGYAGRLRPKLQKIGPGLISLEEQKLGRLTMWFEQSPRLLFTENETNVQRLYSQPNTGRFVKDAFHEYLIKGREDAVNPDLRGTKACASYLMTIPPGESRQVRLRLGPEGALPEDPAAMFEDIFTKRVEEADEFYSFACDRLSPDGRRVQRQALAGLLWSRQFYHYVIDQWLNGDPAGPTPPATRKGGRNSAWIHLFNEDVLTMPDKWEYPWYAAWDTAFHMIPLAMIDPDAAKSELARFLREWFMHPNGQIPAYEWKFDDVNPPVHAWSCWRVYQIDAKLTGRKDTAFLERVFHKLLMNFTWWVNRKDTLGNNVFEGGFLGLDNIGLFDRSSPAPGGGIIEQSDGTSWMAMYCLNMLKIALELAQVRPVYEDIASKFFEHFLFISAAMNSLGDGGLWDDADGFYFDRLRLPTGRSIPLKVRSMVGLIPLFAVDTLEPETMARLPGFRGRMQWFIDNRPDLCRDIASMTREGVGERRLLCFVPRDRLRRILRCMLDESEFLSPYGLRSLSKFHEKNPYTLRLDGTEYRVEYEPAESRTYLFGGNSNWRGPVWFPVNYLMIESLQKLNHYWGESLTAEIPTGSGVKMNLGDVAAELSRRLGRLFLRDVNGRRPVFGGAQKFQNDPNFRDHLLFYEYFHGDNGAGIGASHQTGWTALVAKLLQQSGE